MFTPKKAPPTAEELARLGLTMDEARDPPIEVWPENEQAVIVFIRMMGQWRMGFNGPVALDYAVLPEMWERTKTPPEDRDEVFECIRVMEDTALRVMRKAQEAARGSK